MPSRALTAATLVVPLMLMMACDQGSPRVDVPEATLTASPSPSPTPTSEPTEEATTEPDPLGDETPYVVFPEIGAVEVDAACQTKGHRSRIYRAELENGGTLELRRLAGGFLHGSAIPAPGADPVGTNVPSDSSFTEDGGWLNGTSVMWLAGTENNIRVEYHVRWDDSIARCETS